MTYYRKNDITGVIDGTFATAEEGSGEMVTIDLKPGGASTAVTKAVTERNKEEYVDLMVECRISNALRTSLMLL